MYEIEQLREAYKKLNYTFFEQGDFNLNLIAVRENQVFENKFSDVLHVVYKEAGVWKNLAIKWTTLAGTLGFGGEQNPLTAAQTGTGASGTAVIIPNQYRRVYKFIDSYWGWLSYPYFAQIGSMKYWRDNDKNGVITKGVEYVGNYATNLHRMSNNNIDKDLVNTNMEAWSQGCNGAPEPHFKRILPIVRNAVKLYGDVFSYTILDKEQIV